jgi:glycosyltransferase involved in cell wall biosynthesis
MKEIAPADDVRGITSSPALKDCAISFIIPAFNEEKFLPETLASIHAFAGTRRRYEIIVVDNGSTDNTVARAHEHGAIAHVVTGGTVGALRNYGAGRASGSLLVFLDADVVLTEYWSANIESTLEELDADPLVITGSACGIPPDAGWLERNWFGPWRTGRSSHINSGHMVLTRSLFERLGGFDEQLHTGEDYEFSLRAQRAGAQLESNPQLAVIHNGYPKTLKAFIKREVWHGQSDFVTLKAIMRSGIAIAVLVFLALHAIAITGLAAGAWRIAVPAAGAIILMCIAMSVRQYRNEPATVIISNTVIYYLYFVARSMALFKAQTSSSSYVHRDDR